MKKILVTGDRGYVGAVLIPLLLKNHFDVLGLDADYFHHLLPNKKSFARYKKITKDIRRVEKNDLEGIDSIIHLSALSNDPTGEIDVSLTSDINFQASIRLAELAKKVGIKRFVFSSSCSVYGDNGEKKATEDDPTDPLTPYAKSKINTEKALKEIATNSFSPIILRSSTVYGYSPKMRLDLAVNNLVAYALASGKITLLSDGKAWRPFIHVYDLTNIFIMMLKSSKKLIHNQIFNVGSDDQNYLISNIALEIQKQLPNCQIVFGDKASSDKRNYKVDFQKLKKTFPLFKFKMNIPSGIAELIKVFSQSKLTLKDMGNEKYIRLNAIKKLLKNHKIDKKLYRR